MTKAITEFGVGTITIYLNIDPFLEETEGEEKSNDDWDHLLDFNIDDVPLLGKEGLLPFVTSAIRVQNGENSRNKKRAMENLNFFYQDVGTSSSAGVKLCLEHEVKKGSRVVKKELIVALRGEIYFVKFIINPEEDDVEHVEETEGEEKSNDDWDHLLDFNIDDVPLLGKEGLLPFVCRMGKIAVIRSGRWKTLTFSIKM
nr:hypothetical protein [Tanacetum cinerariifolium]